MFVIISDCHVLVQGVPKMTQLVFVCMPKIIKFGADLTKFWQKQVGSFFWHTLYYCCTVIA